MTSAQVGAEDRSNLRAEVLGHLLLQRRLPLTVAGAAPALVWRLLSTSAAPASLFIVEPCASTNLDGRHCTQDPAFVYSKDTTSRVIKHSLTLLSISRATQPPGPLSSPAGRSPRITGNKTHQLHASKALFRNSHMAPIQRLTIRRMVKWGRDGVPWEVAGKAERPGSRSTQPQPPRTGRILKLSTSTSTAQHTETPKASFTPSNIARPASV